MAEAKHSGGCHCGAVRYTVELDLETPALSCNCSMCGRNGSLLLFVPAAKLTIEKGEDNLTDYQFNKHVIHHTFCKTCGIRPFARGTNPKGEAMAAVNARTIDDIDVFTIAAKQFDGRSR